MTAKNPNLPLNIPPTFYDSVSESLTIDLTSLTHLVFIRYKLLKMIYEETENKKNRDISFIVNEYQKYFDWSNPSTINNDICSHLILALCLCKTESDLKWFIKQETKMYKQKIESNKYNMYEILKKLGIKLEKYDKTKHKGIDYNKVRFKNVSNNNSINDNIYFCDFEDALNLLPSKEFYLNKGRVFIPENELQRLFTLVFEENLTSTINKIKLRSSYIKSDIRINEVAKAFEIQKEQLLNEEALKLEKSMPNEEKLRIMQDVDKFSERAFPLCMTLIERHINKYSHLMHQGRLQYTLFLKGAGLPLEEALKFFQEKYSKKTNIDKFNKEYAYNIRHSYGKEGKRQDYAPYSCDKVIHLNSPSGQECHGCPFKTYSAENLKGILASCGIREDRINEIIAKKRNNEYQLACQKLFDAKFPKMEGSGVGIHPNKYFSSAMKAMKNISKGKTGGNDNDGIKEEDEKKEEEQKNDGMDIEGN